MKRVGFALCAVLGAWLYWGRGEPESAKPGPNQGALTTGTESRGATKINTPAATLPGRTKSKQAKPMTPARAALGESSPPVVAGLSIDLQGSPREQLLARKRRIAPARAAQLDRLGDRRQAKIEQLEGRLATARGKERERLERDLQLLRRNDDWRRRVVPSTVRGATRPGTARR